MTGTLAATYTSGSQRARVVTESWGEQNLYCPNCSSPKLNRLEHNTKASDFSCPRCKFWYQLKGQKTPIRSSITDGAYESMMDAIRHDRTPNFYFMQYELATWRIVNLLLVPHFAFPPSAIIKRKPLSATARRHGWVGCNFALDRIPIDARITIVRDQIIAPAGEVRDRFRKVKPLSELSVTERGWTLDVLTIVRRLEAHGLGPEGGTPTGRIRTPEGGTGDPPVTVGNLPTGSSVFPAQGNLPAEIPSPRPASRRTVQASGLCHPGREFTNQDIYAFERELETLHPGNRHIRDKIRQQLQILRDRGFLRHLSRNRWQVLPAS